MAATDPFVSASAETISIWIAPDGRIFLHNVTGDMVAIAHALNPSDVEMAKRHRLLSNSAEPATATTETHKKEKNCAPGTNE